MPLLKKPKLLWVVRDADAPTLTTVTFVSNNATTTLAKVGDKVTLWFTWSENLYNIVVSIAWHNVTPIQVTPTQYTAEYTMVSGDTSWQIPFTIDFKDINWVSWTQVTATTWLEIVTFDKTAPTLASATYWSSTQLTVTLSELAKDTTITKANAWGFSVFETWTPATTYAVSAIAPWATDDLVVLTVADMTASALVWVTVAYTAWGNWTVADPTWNTMATNATWVEVPAWDALPFMESAERLANTTLKVFISELCTDWSITKANDWWFVVHELWTPATTYAVSAISKSGSNADQIELTVADVTASASVWLTVKYTQGWNGTVADLNSNLMATDATWVNIASWA